MAIKRLEITVSGIVQGVGFRPFVYNLAKRLNLSGHILNNKTGVTIEIEGAEDSRERFLDALKNEPPPLSRIAGIAVSSIPAKNDGGFRILHSSDSGDDVTLISPDNDLCKNCLRELLDKNDRRYRYPFINCTDCGPRYTLIRKTPYDRPYTSMSVFKMCGECQAEYDNPDNRRFHAQPNACPLCGPHAELLDEKGEKIKSDDPVKDAAALIKNGKIVAIKGVGGYHLACDATNEAAVGNLRKRKMRKEKPFAVMSDNIEEIRKYAFVDDIEERLLTSREKPIVLLRKKNGALAEPIAPGLKEYGTFLPYTPIQHLLFTNDDAPLALVMTSGNVSDEPVVFDDEAVLERLGGIADYFLINNRPIVWRCDDSVVRVFGGKAMIYRRSRGWVPAPIFIDVNAPPMLACGGDIKSVFCLAKGSTVFPGPHIGDLEHAEAFDSFRKSIDHFKSIFKIEPELIVVDKHPAYFSSNYGRSLGLPVTEVQHHHAHIASVMLENGLNRDVIGLALDGTGYGDDNVIWGGEVMIASFREYERRFHFPSLKLPGGEKAIKEPWRIAVSLLYQYYEENLFDAHPKFVNAIGEDKIRKIINLIEADINCPVSTSAGRLFDAASSLLLVQHFNNYDGQAPILLESYADRTVKTDVSFSLNPDGEIDFQNLITQLVIYANSHSGAPEGAAIFHNTIAGALTECCNRIKKETGILDVCLGGGVFQNLLLLGSLKGLLEKGGFKVHLPNRLPVNDGGLAAGQIAVALSNL
jgi:hydrogenase maturation protein HypF